MSYPIFRTAAAAVILLSPAGPATAAIAGEQTPDLGYARNGGLPYERPDLGYARNGGVPDEQGGGDGRDGGLPYQWHDLGYSDNEVTVPARDPAPLAPADNGVDTDALVLAGATGAAVLGLGLAGAMLLRRGQHPRLPQPI